MSSRRSPPPAKDCPTLTFFLLRRFHPAPLARPFSKGLLASGLAHFRFHTAARIHPPPSARPFSKGLPTSGLSLFRFRTASWIHSPPSARPFSKGLLASGLSHFRFHTASRIHPPHLARPFSKGLPTSDYLSFSFAPLRESILRLRRAPSLRGYSLRTISLSLSHRCGDPSSAFGAPLL